MSVRSHNPFDLFRVSESGLWLRDNTIADVSTSRHGLVPKAPNDTTKFLRGDGTWGVAGAASANHAYYTYKAAMLEPLAIEKVQTGAFSYAINSSTTKLMLASYNTRLGASGRFETRDPIRPIPLRDVTVTGLGSDATGVFIDPTLPTYTDARTTYYDRLNTLATSSIIYLALPDDQVSYALLPGPYGSIIVGLTCYDLTWVIAQTWGSGFGWNLANEIGDTGSSDYQRLGHGLAIPLSKNVCAFVQTGQERTSNVGKGGIAYINCASSWGKVTDSNSYIFRDDFMGTALDTGSTWTRSQSTVGNVEIQSAGGVKNWCKSKGDGATWGNNGIRSQTTTSRATGKVFMVDVFTWDGAGAGGAGLSPNLVVGWNDNSGLSYSNFAHGLDFTESGGVRRLQVFENGNDRGAVGSGYSLNTIYRVRITLGASNNATYEIQGGTQYQPIGGSSWTDITPGTSSSSTTPLAAGFTQLSASTTYLSDVKLY